MSRTLPFLLAVLTLSGCPGGDSKAKGGVTDVGGAKTAAHGKPKAAAASAPKPKGETDVQPAWAIYSPPDLPAGKRPVLFAFHPRADWRKMIATWGPVADELGWFVLASKNSRNGMDMGKTCRDAEAAIQQLATKRPFDLTRVASTGYSGGGMTSHAFAQNHPKLIRAILPNTGMIHPNLRARAYPKAKLVAFLASPTDTRYDEMQSDKTFLEGLGWKVTWVEFKGGHVIAPHAACLKAARWVDTTWN